MKNYNIGKKMVLDTINRVYNLGLTTTSGGNISMMDDDGDIFITPSGVDKGTLTVDDIMVVKASGEIIGKHTPSMELPFHSNIYKSRQGVKAVVHAHSPAIVAYATARALPQQDSIMFYNEYFNKINGSRYALPGSLKLGGIIMEEFMTGSNVVMMDNHGATACGKDLQEAFMRYEALDFLATTLINAATLGSVKPCYSAENAVILPYNKQVVDFDYSAQAEEMTTFIKRSYRNKLLLSCFGTLAKRIDKDTFIINADDCDRPMITNSDYIIVKNGKAINSNRPCAYANTAMQIFNKMPEVNDVFFSIAPGIMSFAITHTLFNSRLIPESYIMLRDVKVVECGDVIDCNPSFFKNLSTLSPVVVAENECAVAIGKNLTKAFDRMEVLEYSARSVIMASKVCPITPISDAEVQEINDTFNGW